MKSVHSYFVVCRHMKYNTIQINLLFSCEVFLMLVNVDVKEVILEEKDFLNAIEKQFEIIGCGNWYHNDNSEICTDLKGFCETQLNLSPVQQLAFEVYKSIQALFQMQAEYKGEKH